MHATADVARAPGEGCSGRSCANPDDNPFEARDLTPLLGVSHVGKPNASHRGQTLWAGQWPSDRTHEIGFELFGREAITVVAIAVMAPPSGERVALLMAATGASYPPRAGPEDCVRYEDWGDRCPRWAGVHSVMTSLADVPVHYLAAESTTPLADGAPTHVLVPPMTGSAAVWIDLVAQLRAVGPVVAPDSPGTLTGHTGAAYRGGSRARPDAGFIRALLTHLDLDRVVLHSWSMGGLVALMAADLTPSRVAGLVLAAPTLPWRRTARFEALAWHTVGRAALAAALPAGRLALRIPPVRDRAAGRRAVETGELFTGKRAAAVGGDPQLVSPEQRAVIAEELADLDARRLPGTVTAFASAIRAMFIDQRSTLQLLGRVSAPVLVLWGTDDQLIDQPSHWQHAQRPGWTPHPIEGAGHLLPIERPDDYVATVHAWMQDTVP